MGHLSKNRLAILARALAAIGSRCSVQQVSYSREEKFFNLPELHPMDRQEVASAIHILQNKLLSRPTYRKYIEAAKQGRK